MRDPFFVEGPALISFSGGRTSAYMLRRILDAHRDRLPDDVHVAFANTGKERPETLDFVHECETRWGVPVEWVERDPARSARKRGSFAVRRVTYETASRDGAPFATLLSDIRRIRTRKQLGFYLPNPAKRICTTELKIRVMKRVMRLHGHAHWDVVMGIRADEPSRVRKLREPTAERWEHSLPLADAGVTEADVMAFWAAQPFDLALKPHEGNCDLCFLKDIDKRVVLMTERPELAVWWAEQERLMGLQFLAGTKSRKGEPGYAALNTAQWAKFDEDGAWVIPSARSNPTGVDSMTRADHLAEMMTWDERANPTTKGDTVDVFLNLNQTKSRGVPIYSVRENKIVIDHVPSFSLRNPKMHVGAGTQQRIMAGGEKSIHAWLTGERVMRGAPASGWVRIRYNPRELTTFVYATSGKPVYEAKWAKFDATGVWVIPSDGARANPRDVDLMTQEQHIAEIMRWNPSSLVDGWWA